MKQDTCGKCRFHETLGSGLNGAEAVVPVGKCMRYPPQITPNGSSAAPVVGSNTSWCGEFAAAPAPAMKSPPLQKKKARK